MTNGWDCIPSCRRTSLLEVFQIARTLASQARVILPPSSSEFNDYNAHVGENLGSAGTIVYVFHPPVFHVCLDQFVAEGLYGDAEPNNANHGNDADSTGGGPRKTSRVAQRRNRRVSRIGHAVDDGGGVAAFPRGCRVPNEPVLENSGLQSDSCGVVWLLSARHHSARLLFPGWCGTAVFHSQPHREGCALRGIIRARTVAFIGAGCAGRISPLHGPLHDLFHF